MSCGAPPADVLRAFGVEGPPRALPGGQGTSWAVGRLVLAYNVDTTTDTDTCSEWLGSVLSDVRFSGVRVATPVRTRHSAWRHAGWSATERVAGVHPSHGSVAGWLDIIEAGRAFHRSVRHLARPRCLDERTDPWAAADRTVWGERPLRAHPAIRPTALRVAAADEPLGGPQLVHGDLTGNVLFARDLPPAVIDLSPYWRPPAYAEGVVLADALCWHDAPPSLLLVAGVSVTAVARGLLFRMLTTSERVARGELPEEQIAEEAHRYERAAAAIGL